MGLWQLPLLCLAFLGTRNVGQRTNDYFCSLGFSRFPYSVTVAAQFVSVRVPVLSGSKRTFQGLRKIGRSARKRLVTWKVTLTRGRKLARHDAACVSFFIRAARLFGPIPSFFLSFFSLDPTLPLLALLLISGYPGLRLTNCFRLRALRVSTFPSLPFFSFKR